MAQQSDINLPGWVLGDIYRNFFKFRAVTSTWDRSVNEFGEVEVSQVILQEKKKRELIHVASPSIPRLMILKVLLSYQLGRLFPIDCNVGSLSYTTSKDGILYAC